MQEDNLYQNEGSSFFSLSEPADQVLDRKHEKAEVIEAQKEIQKVIDRLDERIKEAGEIASAFEVRETYKVSFETAATALNILVDQLKSEKQILTDLLEVHSQQR